MQNKKWKLFTHAEHQRVVRARPKVFYWSNWSLEVLVFAEGGKPEKPGEKPSKLAYFPQTPE